MSDTTADLVYAFDPTGKLSANKITGEQHILTATNWRDYHFIVPKLAPFFTNGVKLKFSPVSGGAAYYLTEGVDFYFSHKFIDATKACSAEVWGSISFLNTKLAGVVTIESYQTLGGIWVADDAKIAEILANYVNNPRITTWDSVIDMPVKFPVIDHEWDLVDMVGMSELIAGLAGIEAQLRSQTQSGLQDHIDDKSNPHNVTAAQVNLGNVKNYPIATTAEAIAGLIDTAYMTPAKVKSYVSAAVGVGLSEHLVDFNNPHNTTAAQVGAYTIAQVDSLLTNYLKTTGTAANASKFGGMTTAEFAASVLTGTAANATTVYGMTLNQLRSEIQGGASANAVQFDGRTFAEAMAEILTGTAAAAATFGGMTFSELVAYILTQTIANSTHLNGLSQAELTAAILSGTAANADRVGGYTPAQLATMVLTGTAANAVKFDGLTSEEWSTVIKSYTVANASKLAGLSIAELTAQILSGTAANAKTIENLSVAALTSQILTGTAANASKLDGYTLSELVALVSSSASTDASTLVGYTLAQILAMTVANSTKFNGLTPEQWTTAIQAMIDGSVSTSASSLSIRIGNLETATTSLSGEVTNHSSLLNSLNNTVVTQGTAISTSSANIQTLLSWKGDATAAINSLTAKTNTLTTNLAALTTTATGTSDNLATLTTDFAAFKAETTDAFVALTEAFNDLAAQINKTT